MIGFREAFGLWGRLAVGSLVLLLAASASGEIRMTELRLWAGVTEPTGDEPHHETRFVGERINRWTTGVTDPVLTVYHPSTVGAAACVVCPGGGYAGLALDKEGHFVAQWLAERGVMGVLLPYRCGGGPHAHPVPRDDVQRALQTVRSNAVAWGVDSTRIGVLGFSAGGHLAATAATQWLDADPDADDPLRRVSSRPDFAVLVYPVISMRDGVTHLGSRNHLLGDSPTAEAIAELSADERVTPATPPTLLIHSVDDASVPVENAQRFYDACRRHAVPVEMHLYETGEHGYGMWSDTGSVTQWPAALQAWLAARGLTPGAE